ADVAGAVAVHVARLGVGELVTLEAPYVELGHDQRVADVDDPVPAYVAAWGGSDRGGCRAPERRGGRRGDGRADRGVGRVGVVEVEAAVLVAVDADPDPG